MYENVIRSFHTHIEKGGGETYGETETETETDYHKSETSLD